MDRVVREGPNPQRMFSSFVTLLLLTGMLALSDIPADAAPVAGKIVYMDIFGRPGLYSIAPDGTDRTRLVDGLVYGPKWRPDRSGVSFIVGTGQRARPSRLDTIDDDGSNRQVMLGRAQLPTGWKTILSYDWSPDGTQLVLCLADAR